MQKREIQPPRQRVVNFRMWIYYYCSDAPEVDCYWYTIHRLRVSVWKVSLKTIILFESCSKSFVVANAIDSVVVYLRCTDRAEQFLTSPRAQMTIRLPSSASKRSRTPTISPASRRKAATDGDGWIATRKTSSSTKRRRSSTTSVGSRKRTATSKKKAKTDKSQSTKKGTKPKKKDSNKPSKQSKISQFAADNGTQSSRAKPAEVIDIDDDSSLDEPLVGGLSAGRAVENHGQQSAQRPRRAASMKNNQQHIVGDDLASDCGEDEEYEFEAWSIRDNPI